MLRIHRCDHLIAAAFTAPEYKSAVARVLSNHREERRACILQMIRNLAALTFHYLSVCCARTMCCFYQLTQMPAVENNGGTIVTPCLMVSSCACASLGGRPSAFLIPAPSSREMFAMQIECMLSAKAHTHTNVDAFTAAGMFLSSCKIISSIPVLILARVHFTMQIETATTTWNRSTFKVEPLLVSAFFTRRALLSWQSCWNF